MKKKNEDEVLLSGEFDSIKDIIRSDKREKDLTNFLKKIFKLSKIRKYVRKKRSKKRLI